MSILGSNPLTKWFIFVTPCLFIKESLNHWAHLRHQKRQGDAMDDAGDTFENIEEENKIEAPKATRKEKVKRPRAH